MFVTLHVAVVLLLLLSIIKSITPTRYLRPLKLFIQSPLSRLVVPEQSHQNISNFKCGISLYVYQQSLQFQCHSNAKILSMKMTILPVSSYQYTPSYDEIFPTNISNPKCQVNIWSISNRSFISKYPSKVHKSNADRNPRISSSKCVYYHCRRINTDRETSRSFHRTFRNRFVSPY